MEKPMHEIALSYSLAVTTDDFEQVFRLNHATFTNKIPQHAAQARTSQTPSPNLSSASLSTTSTTLSSALFSASSSV
jgi:hypothetical protein